MSVEKKDQLKPPEEQNGLIKLFTMIKTALVGIIDPSTKLSPKLRSFYFNNYLNKNKEVRLHSAAFEFVCEALESFEKIPLNFKKNDKEAIWNLLNKIGKEATKSSMQEFRIIILNEIDRKPNDAESFHLGHSFSDEGYTVWAKEKDENEILIYYLADSKNSYAKRSF